MSREEYIEQQKAIIKDLKTIETYAHVKWTAHDIKTLRPKWSLKKCEEWLIDNEKYVIDGMISAGWEIIENLL